MTQDSAVDRAVHASKRIGWGLAGIGTAMALISGLVWLFYDPPRTVQAVLLVGMGLYLAYLIGPIAKGIWRSVLDG